MTAMCASFGFCFIGQHNPKQQFSQGLKLQQKLLWFRQKESFSPVLKAKCLPLPHSPLLSFSKVPFEERVFTLLQWLQLPVDERSVPPGRSPEKSCVCAGKFKETCMISGSHVHSGALLKLSWTIYNSKKRLFFL